MTINKSEGQSLEKVSIYFDVRPFSHGQTYVALSRTKNFKNNNIFSNSKKIKNIVHKGILIKFSL